MLRQHAHSLCVAAGAAGGGGLLTAAFAALGLTSFDAVWPVVTTCGVVGGLVDHSGQGLAALVDNRTHTLRNRVERIRRDVSDVHGLVRLAPYTRDLPLPIGGGWALTGDSAALLAREVLERKPATILELGSGASTLILGQILRKAGTGRLLSVDHDRTWADQTRRYVDLLGLGEVVTVIEAPLASIPVQGKTYHWYDIPARDLDDLGPVDLLLVDGPPQRRDSPDHARYPAFPLLRDRLSPHALIFVDDAHRTAESEMVERWTKEAAEWKPSWFDTIDGVCILTRE